MKHSLFVNSSTKLFRIVLAISLVFGLMPCFQVRTALAITEEAPSTAVGDGSLAEVDGGSTAELSTTNVAEVGGVQYATLGDAFTAAQEGQTITLLADILDDDVRDIWVTKSVTLNMASHTIKSDNLKPDGSAYTDDWYDIFYVNGAGITFTITGNGTIEGPDGAQAVALDARPLFEVGAGTLIIQNGTIKCGGVGDCGMYGIYVHGGDVVLGDSSGNGPTIEAWFAAVTTTNGQTGGNVTITGGTYTSKAAPGSVTSWERYCAALYLAGSGNAIISGGTFNGAFAINSPYTNVTQEIAITGGSFTGDTANNRPALTTGNYGTGSEGKNPDTKKAAVSGGSYSSQVPANMCAEGFEQERNPDGTYGVKEKTYTITFDPQGGTMPAGVTFPSSYTYGTTTAIPSNAPTKADFVFAGWYKDTTYSGSKVTEISATQTENITLYAKWEKAGGDKILNDGHTYFFFSAVTGKPMEIGGGSTENGAGVNQYSLNNTGAQQWKVTYDNDNYATLWNGNASDSMVLDVSCGNAYSGAKVQLYENNGSDAQKWRIELSDDKLIIRSKLNNDFVLDLFGASTEDCAQIWLYGNNDTNAQRWADYDITAMKDEMVTAARNSSTVVAAGTYVISAKCGTNRSLDVSGGSADSGANVQSYETNGTDAQKWIVSYESNDGYATIKNASGKVLDVSCGSTVPGANVQQYDSNNSAAQKWAFVRNEDDSIKIVSALFPNLVLDVSGASGDSGANVQSYFDNGTVAQQWVFATA